MVGQRTLNPYVEVRILYRQLKSQNMSLIRDAYVASYT